MVLPPSSGGESSSRIREVRLRSTRGEFDPEKLARKAALVIDRLGSSEIQREPAVCCDSQANSRCRAVNVDWLPLLVLVIAAEDARGYQARNSGRSFGREIWRDLP